MKKNRKIIKFFNYFLAIFFISILINIIFIFSIFIGKGKINIQGNHIDKVYDLTNYVSSSNENQNLKKRLDKLYEQYLQDIKKPKEEHYNGIEIKLEWKQTCITNLRRIINILSKIEILEKSINIIISDNSAYKSSFDSLIEKKGYRDKLTDMSNFYATFISDKEYNFLQITSD